MERLGSGTTANAEVQFAYDFASSMAGLLRRAGHIDLALLLDSVGDVDRLDLWRVADGGAFRLIRRGDAVTHYVASQLSDLAEMMSRSGAGDAAMLFRLAGQMLMLPPGG